MKNIHYLVTSLLCALVFAFAGCKKEDSIAYEKTKVTGYVEKGPFISGSKVTIYELDDELNGTGKIFESTTDNTGYFEMNTLKFASKYVKLSVNGFFFNEVTGALSNAPITLEAITNIEENDQININLLTHLEMQRVKKLILEEKKDFAAAKEQAEKELLACFKINKDVVPEKAGITNNDMSANILIAVSSILLRNRTEAQFSELISYFSSDLKNTGTVREEIKEAIKQSSYRLNYIQVKENIIERYKNLGINDVQIGNFQYYIDGDGDGTLGEGDYPIDKPDVISVDEYFKDENTFRTVMASSIYSNTKEFVENYLLIEALYSQSLNISKINTSNDYKNIYNHQVSPGSNLISDIYKSTYKAIRNYNIIIEKATKSEFLKFGYASRVYRAYHYWVMTELWGDVPLMLSIPSMEEALDVKRASKSKILDQLIADLISVAPYLPTEQDGVICSRDFAEALLARIYLSKSDFANASATTAHIIQGNRYQLVSPSNKAFELVNSETIFSLDTASVTKNSFYTQHIKKGQATPLIRYAEMLLTAAEAAFRQNNYSETLQYLNMVRYRNGKAPVTNISNKDIIQNALLEEWKEDLSNEGLWFSVLKRFGVSETVLGIPSYMNLLPLPGIEVNLSPGMTQNPGY